MGDIRKALTDKQLDDLVHNTFDPDERVFVVINERVSKFAEDLFITNERKKPRAKPQRSSTTPYEDYSKTYSEWLKIRSKKECNASVVLGGYFVRYKETFGEQDPEWAGKGVNIKNALFYIQKMASDLTENDFYKILEFAETIIPMWGKAMKKNLKFPTSRPTFDTFFVKRGMYSQRFAKYKEWKNL